MHKFCGHERDHAEHEFREFGTEHSCPGFKFAGAQYEEVNHPAHYGGDTPYEVIKVLEEWTDMFRLPVNVTSAIKYLTRAGRKPGVSRETDLRKALWHIQREIDRKVNKPEEAREVR